MNKLSFQSASSLAIVGLLTPLAAYLDLKGVPEQHILFLIILLVPFILLFVGIAFTRKKNHG